MNRVTRALLAVVLLFLLIGLLPLWPYSGSWGYFPSGGAGLLLLILLVALLIGGGNRKSVT